VAFILVMSIMLGFLCYASTQIQSEIIPTISRVVMHNPTTITLISTKPGSTELVFRTISTSDKPIKVFTGVPPHKSKWAYIDREGHVEVHIHSGHELEVAGLNLAQK